MSITFNLTDSDYLPDYRAEAHTDKSPVGQKSLKNIMWIIL